MRKQFFAIISMTAAALAVLSCAKVADVMDAPSKGITINVKAGDDMTRTMAVDGEIPTIKWTAGDNVLLFEVVDGALVDASTSDGALIDEEGRASFVTPIDWDDAGTAGTSAYQYSAVYPSSAVYASGGVHFLFLPDDQYLVGNNFSDDSDLLISTVLDHGNTRATQDEDIMFTFRRVGTVVRLRLKGIPEGAKINQVTLQAPVDIAGTINYDPITGKVDPASAFEIYGTETVNLIASDLVATGDDVIWFRVMCDEDWAAGADFSIKVVTDQGTYLKEVTLPAAIRFPDGGLTRFGVDLSDSFSATVPVPVLWDFEDGAAGWTFSDDDGDGNNWDVVTGFYAHSGNHVLRSQSYNGSALYPDNWAYTPSVQLTEGNYLSFWIRAQDIDWKAEHYEVYIESDSGELTTLIAETEYPDGDCADLGEDLFYQRFVVRIPEDYANQVVRIAFRHFNCTDEFALNLDDVEILEEEPVVYTADYADYLGEWTDGTRVFTIEQKDEGSTYTILSGFVDQQYPLEAVFQHNRLFVYEQVVASNGTEDLALQGLYSNNGSLEWYSDLSSLNVLFVASINDETGALDITPAFDFVYYVWTYYADQKYDSYGYYAAIPGVLLPYVYVPDTNTYIYQEGFESGTDGWSFFDKNEDGYGWQRIIATSINPHSGDYVLLSRSWIDATVGGITPDNYAFTPAIALTTDNSLSFWVSASQKYPDEHYAVYVTTEVPSASNLPTSNPIFEQTYNPEATVGNIQYPNLVERGFNGYQHYVIPLSGYDNQTVYIGFRHYGCTDWEYLLLDDVGVMEGAPVSDGAPAQAAPRKVTAPKVHGSSIRREAPKAQRHVLDRTLGIKSR